MGMQIHVNRDGQQFGPYSVEQIKELLGQGSLLTTDWVWYDGLSEWVQILQIEDFSSDSSQTQEAAPVQAAESEVTPPIEADKTPQPATAAKGGGVSASAVAERLRRLNKGQKPAPSRAAQLAKQAAAAEPDGSGISASAKGKIVQAIVIVLLLAAVGALVAFNLPKAKRKLPNVAVAKDTTQATAKKILGLEGAHLTRDANDEISGIMFPGIPISTNGWKSLGELKNLQRLSLINCEVNDGDLVNLKGLAALTLLDVSDNPITDKAVDVVKGLTALTELNLTGTKITSAGVAAIKKALPDCAVKREGAAPPGKGDPKGKPK